MFDIKDKIEKEDMDFAFVLILESEYKCSYYDEEFNLRNSSSNDSITDCKICYGYADAKTLLEVFFNFDYQDYMEYEYYIFVVDKNNNILDRIKISKNKRKHSLLKRTKKEMMKNHGSVFKINELFDLPNIHLSLPEIKFLNACYGNYVMGNKKFYFYQSYIAHYNAIGIETYITPDTNFNKFEKYVTGKSYINSLIEYSPNKCEFFYVLFEADDKIVNKIKLAVDVDVFKKIRNIKER